MEKNCSSSALSTNNSASASASASATTSTNSNTTTTSHNTTATIRMLNKNSYKISKPNSKHHQHSHGPISANFPDPAADASDVGPPPSQALPAAQQPQPPVYNINKNDFRDVVQKLTGSPAHLHNRVPSPPVASPLPPATKPSSSAATTTSRLHKIRPPPLSHLGPRPPPLLHPDPAVGSACDGAVVTAGGGNVWMRPAMMSMPNSPLPPFPTVSGAAESPITAYLRCLHGGGSGGSYQQQSAVGSLGAPLFPLPTSPLAFGCLPSPRSAFQSTLPPSPRVPMPSPKWDDQ